MHESPLPALEYVVLVDSENRPLGTAPKHEVHHAHTPLHRGFSVFVFMPSGEFLLQQRARTKKTFPLLWSNSCCGHPMLDETAAQASKRRLAFEMGMHDVLVRELISDYRYEVEMGGIYEREICPIAVGYAAAPPVPNPDEVEATKTMPWEAFLTALDREPNVYSLWCREEALLLNQHPDFQAFLRILRGSSGEGNVLHSWFGAAS